MQNIIPTTLAAISLVISAYVIATRSNMEAFTAPHSLSTPKDVAKAAIHVQRFDGLESYFQEHRTELVKNLEVNNILENGDVALAFIHTSARNKQYKFCLWLIRSDSGWSYAPYLSRYSENPFMGKWIKENEEWLDEMNEKIKDWQSQSSSMLTISESYSQHMSRESKRKAILNNLRQIASGADQYFLENGVTSVLLKDLIGRDKYVRSLVPVAGETYPSTIRQGVDIKTYGSNVGDMEIEF